MNMGKNGRSSAVSLTTYSSLAGYEGILVRQKSRTRFGIQSKEINQTGYIHIDSKGEYFANIKDKNTLKYYTFMIPQLLAAGQFIFYEAEIQWLKYER